MKIKSDKVEFKQKRKPETYLVNGHLIEMDWDKILEESKQKEEQKKWDEFNDFSMKVWGGFQIE